LDSPPETRVLLFWRVLIIAVSYDFENLNRRMQALERAGNAVLPASSLQSCMNAIFNPFHVLVIGASVPQADREAIAAESKKVRPNSEIISVEWPDSRPLRSADIRIPAGDEKILLEAVKRLQYGK
jgi:hypothetical protein